MIHREAEQLVVPASVSAGSAAADLPYLDPVKMASQLVVSAGSVERFRALRFVRVSALSGFPLPLSRLPRSQTFSFLAIFKNVEV